MPFYQVLISATTEREVFRILDELTKKRLVAGGLVTKGKSQYWWNGKRVKKTYLNLSAFTRSGREKKIISLVRSLHSDKTPIIAFTGIAHANKDFLDWIKDSTTKQ